MLALVADLTKLASVDRDADHYTMVGGASIYPMAWSILLAAREEGLGGVMTTMVVRSQDEARAALGVPDHCIVAAVLALGPSGAPTHPTAPRPGRVLRHRRSVRRRGAGAVNRPERPERPTGGRTPPLIVVR